MAVDTSSSKSPPTSSSEKLHRLPGFAESCSFGASAQLAKASSIILNLSPPYDSCSVFSKLVSSQERSTLSACTTSAMSYNGALVSSSVQVSWLVRSVVCLLMLWHIWMELVDILVSTSHSVTQRRADSTRLALDLHNRRPAHNRHRYHIQVHGCGLAGNRNLPNRK